MCESRGITNLCPISPSAKAHELFGIGVGEPSRELGAGVRSGNRNQVGLPLSLHVHLGGDVVAGEASSEGLCRPVSDPLKRCKRCVGGCFAGWILIAGRGSAEEARVETRILEEKGRRRRVLRLLQQRKAERRAPHRRDANQNEPDDGGALLRPPHGGQAPGSALLASPHVCPFISTLPGPARSVSAPATMRASLQGSDGRGRRLRWPLHRRFGASRSGSSASSSTCVPVRPRTGSANHRANDADAQRHDRPCGSYLRQPRTTQRHIPGTLQSSMLELAQLSRELLPKMWDSNTRLFSHKTRIGRDRTYVNEQANPLYSAIALVGLLEDGAADGARRFRRS